MRRLPPLTAALIVLAAAAACATPPQKPEAHRARRSTTSVEAVAVAAPDGDAAADAPAADDAPPSTWQDAVARYESTCPAPFFTLGTPETVTTGAGLAFTRAGSTLTLTTPRPAGPLKIGVLGAVKDADPDTRENMKKAAAAFHKAGVQFVVANGDLVGNETGQLAPVVRMLGEEFAVPVFAHAGNYEWTSAFTKAFADEEKTAPHLFDMNLIRDVDLGGGVHLVSLPGYFNRRFLQPGGCRYTKDDVEATLDHVRALRDKGDVVILTSHGPPLGAGAAALDVTNDGVNVGDPDINRILEDGGVAFGLFSHILESGGRAVADPAGNGAVRLPMKAPSARLYVNAGASTSFGWEMVDGKTSRGMAAIFTLEPSAGARVEFISLR